MSFHQFVNNIGFRLVKPNTPLLPIGFDRFTQRLRIGTLFEAFNTRFPDRRMKERLRNIAHMPRMSTLAIGGIINEGVRQMAPQQAFVNIGVWRGFSLFSGILNNLHTTCIGVDNFSQFGGPKEDFYKDFEAQAGEQHHFYEMDYVDYFRYVHQQPIGFYIYDGNHTYQNQLFGLHLAEPFFAEGCHILIDDTDHDPVRRGTLDFLKRSTHEYRVILDERTYCNAHPTFWNGIMLLQHMS